MDSYCEALDRQGRAGEGRIVLGCWAIIAEDPEAEAQRIGEHILYQINAYCQWGAFGPPEQAPVFDKVKDAVENGLYELWDAELAVSRLSALLRDYPQIRDIHFWAQFPGESVASGNRRLTYIAEKVLPRVRQAAA